ncbi:hypothetical protein FQR65_LT06641 [Abscondita terminalis]|nr:hypothetical protein FQR65_LT06641 [Abscondita terminalis]
MRETEPFSRPDQIINTIGIEHNDVDFVILKVKLVLISSLVAIAYAQHGYGHGGSSYASVSLGNSHYGASSAQPIALAHAAPIYSAPIIQAAPIHSSLGYGQGHGYAHQDYYAHPQYQFHYGVSDPHTGDKHSQQESRDGDVVHGEYSLHQPDGTIRTVKYQADGKSGFNAQVIVSGHASHPQSYAPAHASYGHY